MDKRSQLILFCISLFGMLSVMLSCEKDDICAEENITPYLIIRFVDDEDPEDPDDVSSLQIRYIGNPEDVTDNDTLVFDSATTTDSIVLSLPTFKNEATFVFFQDFDDDNEDELSETENTIIKFTYSRTNEYVSRACGFRTIYNDFKTSFAEDSEDSGNSFILGIDDKQTTIEDEEEAHVHLRH